MAHPNPRLLIPIVLISAFGVGGAYVETQRARTRGTLSGYFESQPADLAARVGGRVAAIVVREGDSVRAGQVLLRLEASPDREDAAAKRALAAQARAQWQDAEAGARPEELRRAEARVAELREMLRRLKNGSLP